MQPSVRPRGTSIGLGVELFGIAVAIFALVLPYSEGAFRSIGNPLIAGLGAGIAFIGLILHVARV